MRTHTHTQKGNAKHLKTVKKQKERTGSTCLTSAGCFRCFGEGGKADDVSLGEHSVQIGLPGSHQRWWGQVHLVQHHDHLPLQLLPQVAVQARGQVQSLGQQTNVMLHFTSHSVAGRRTG